MTTYKTPSAIEAPHPEEGEKEEIPIGVGTILGFLGTAISLFLALITMVLDGDYTVETLTAGTSAVVLLSVTIIGRMAQAYAIYSNVSGYLGELPTPPPVNPPPMRRRT